MGMDLVGVLLSAQAAAVASLVTSRQKATPSLPGHPAPTMGTGPASISDFASTHPLLVGCADWWRAMDTVTAILTRP
jgi:hypothetical protein